MSVTPGGTEVTRGGGGGGGGRRARALPDAELRPLST
jgi:hypothetical protein